MVAIIFHQLFIKVGKQKTAFLFERKGPVMSIQRDYIYPKKVDKEIGCFGEM